jgi:membrane protein
MSPFLNIVKQAVQGYIAHGALSRGAAIAFCVVTSLAPVLIIVVAVAGLAFGEDAVRGNLITELRGLFGQQGGELVENLLARSSDKSAGAVASVIGVLMILVTASGVFSEMQTALNRIWDVEASDLPVISMVARGPQALAWWQH